jgi:hypothetical protein
VTDPESYAVAKLNVEQDVEAKQTDLLWEIVD